MSCPKVFSVDSNVKGHLRILTEEKPYPCNQCPNIFSVKNILRIDTGEKPQTCNQCPKTVSVDRNLEKHLSI